MTDTDAPLARLSAAARMLAEARTIDEIKQVRDIAIAAQTYAKAAKLGFKAQNNAAIIRLRAERKAGEFLRQLERNAEGGDKKSLNRPGIVISEHHQAITDADIAPTTAHRWERISTLSDNEFSDFVAIHEQLEKEITATALLRVLKERDREAKREANRELVEQTQPATATVGDTFQTIVMDPPWDWGDEGDFDQYGRARPTYATMTIEQIADLPIPELAQANAHLYLWITNRSLPKGFGLIERWGFRYITALTWVKPSFGMGNYFRGSTEHVLFGVRGSLPLLRNDIPTHFLANRPGIHSGKPDEFYTIVESSSPGPWLELFSRKPRNGWIAWGADANGN